MKTLGAILGLLVFLGGVLRCQAQSLTPEELAVRSTYAKLSFAVDLANVKTFIQNHKGSSFKELDQYVAKNRLRFQIRDLTTGRTADIAGRRVFEFIDKPSAPTEEVLYVIPETSTYSEEVQEPHGFNETVEISARAAWRSAPVATEVSDLQLNQVFLQLEHPEWYDRYSAFRVTAQLAGRTRTYRAMFLFGKNNNGQEVVIAADVVTGTAALELFQANRIYPATLLETELTKNPAVRAWLKLMEAPSSCPSGKREVCCDPDTLTCSIASEDIQNALRRTRNLTGDQEVGSTRMGVPKLFSTSWTLPIRFSEAECDDRNRPDQSFSPEVAHETEEHHDGEHFWTAYGDGSCEYTGSAFNCAGEARALATPVMTDHGELDLVHTLYSHIVTVTNTSATTSGSPGTPISAQAVAAGAIRSCILGFCGNIQIGISGTSVTFPPNTMFQKKWVYQVDCDGYVSPIVIDTKGTGFKLTSVQDGVQFDIRGDDRPITMAWTDIDSGNGFLAMDRNSNGLIDNGKELFGNYTEQPDSPARNGFEALGLLDTPEQGGNADGIISSRDRAWQTLRVWIDSNHDGVSQQRELHNLESLGIAKLSLKYKETRRFDEYGNLFRYRATVDDDLAKAGRFMYDIFFLGVR